MPYKYANNATTTLNGSVTPGQTTITVASASGFPSSGNFTIRIDSEILLVTGVSGTTWTVARGQESTAAAAHDSGVAVTHVLTAAALNDLIDTKAEVDAMATASTYTPTVTNGGTATYTTRTGRYFQLGKIVFLAVDIVVNAAGSGSALIGIDLPVAAVSTGTLGRQVISGAAEGLSTHGVEKIYGWIDAGASPQMPRIRTATGDNLAGSDLAAGARLVLQGWYEAA